MAWVLLAILSLGASVLSANPSLASACSAEAVAPASSSVTITRTDQRFQLRRDGRPYIVRGACAWEHLEELKAAGGNSIRTWGARDDPQLYDEAHALGLSVCAGLWFDWVPDRPEYMRKQFADICSHVRKYKDHPAILMWGIGNEYEVGVSDPRVWEAIEELTAAVKEIDQDHPAITVVAEVSQEKVTALKEYCPSLDALGVNSYGGLLSLPDRLREYGWDKPYFVTEFGELGPYELGKTPWDAPIEMNSTHVAERWIAPGLEL
ncbi:MAG: glycoside hydrolase family 2 TIM barrel-domain containing protein, partial [Planctomycetota bacterium]